MTSEPLPNSRKPENIMNTKLLIKCPSCENRGLKMNLAQVLPDGRIAVRRFDENSVTVVGGDNLYIQCGMCGDTVFRREAYVGTMVSERVSWVLGFQSGTTVGTIGPGSN